MYKFKKFRKYQAGRLKENHALTLHSHTAKTKNKEKILRAAEEK